MDRSLNSKLLAVVGLSAAFTLTACGGGGGDPGTPLVQPTTKLIMTPIISGFSMGVGQYAEPVKISGGQKPYYIMSDTNCVAPKLLDDGTVYLQATCSTLEPTDTDCASSTPSQHITIQDSSYNNGTSTANPQLQFTICVEKAPGLLSTLGTSSTITLVPGESRTFTVSGGTAPYMATSNNNSAVTISGSSDGTFTMTAGNVPGTATIEVIDVNHQIYTVTVTTSSPDTSTGS